MTQFVAVHTEGGCVVCRNIKETDTTITVEINGIIIDNIPKNIVINYV